MDKFSEVQKKDSFNEGSNLEIPLESMNPPKYTVNTLSLKDCLNWQLMKVWPMEFSSPQNKTESLSCLLPKRNRSLSLEN